MDFQQQMTAIRKGQWSPIYLVQGRETYLQDVARNTFLEAIIAPEDQDLNVGRFNMEEVTVQTAVADAESVPFFGDKRLVIIDKPYFLTGEKEKSKLDHQLDTLQQYLEHPLESTILVIFAPYEKLDSRKKVVKQLKKSAVLIDVNPLDERGTRQWIQQVLKHEAITMDDDTLRHFLEKTQYSLTQAMTELNKLTVAALDTRHITTELVDALVAKSLEQNIFELNDAVLNKQTEKALQLYRDLLLQKEDPLKMNGILLGQLRLLLQVSYLLKEGYHEPEMQKALSTHPYRIKLALQQARRFRIQDLERAYTQLVECELALKSGKGIRDMQFELFVLGFVSGR